MRTTIETACTFLSSTKRCQLRLLDLCFRVFSATILTTLWADTLNAQVIWSENGHTYEAVYAPGLTWAQAHAACEARGGYLATISSSAEDAFVKSLFENNPSFWYVDGFGNGLGPWIGGIQSPNSSEPNDGWGWANGELMAYTGWSSNQPDNCCGFNQNRIEYFRHNNAPPTGWDDAQDWVDFLPGYIFESSPSTTSCVPAPSDIVSWWPGDDNANDIKGNNHGTLQNGATFSTGNVGQAFSFDGVDDYVEVPDSPSLTPPSSSITLEAWVKPDRVDGDYVIMSKYNSNDPSVNGVSWYLGLDTIIGPGHLRFAVYQDPSTSVDRTIDTNSPVLTAGVWQHVAATFDLTTQELKVYVDGVEAPSTLSSGSSIITSIADTHTPVRIGVAVHVAGNFANFWDGLIDEAGIYNRALSVSEIESIYNAGSAGKCQPPPPSCVTPPSGLVSWWPGDGNANDIRGNNHGTLQNGATFATGMISQAFSFDGVDDIVRISSIAGIEAQQFTIGAWALAESPGVRNDELGGVIVSKDIGDTFTSPFVSWSLVGLGNTNKYHVDIGFTDGSWHLLPSTNSFPFNTFNHVAATWDGSTLKLYVNGQPEGELNLGPKTVSYSGEALTIGEHNILPAQRAFDGLVDEVEFYNRALSQSEIQSIYNAGSAGKCKDVSDTEVTLRLLDQNGALIPASQFEVMTPPGGNVPQGGTITLPPGDYTIRIFPGLNGVVQGSELHREEVVAVSGISQTIDFVWVTATLQINLVDQDIVSIPSSQFTFGMPVAAGLGDFPNGSTIVLPVTEDPVTSPSNGAFANGYSVRLFPGLNGILQGGYLHRNELCGELSAAGLNLTFVWVTAPLQINLVDQNNVPIPSSQFTLGMPITGLGTFPDGSTKVLPVTEDPATSPINGPFTNGYSVRLFPGLNGILQGSPLHREESCGELSAAGSNLTFVWVTAPLQINLVDQNNVPIPSSQFTLGMPVAGLGDFPNGTTNVLPVTEDPATSPINGTFADGYPARLFPGLDGQLQGSFLYRNEPTVELLASGLVRNVTWEMDSGTLHVVNTSENEVSGSSINQPFLSTISTGTFVSLPVTDNGLYPNIAGTYANGYTDFKLQTAPSNPFEGPFTFKLLSSKIFDPAFVSISGDMFGLRFDLQCEPPIVNAGTDRIICIGETVVLGGNPIATGSGPFTYEWTPTEGLNDPTAANPEARPTSTTIYSVVVTDGNGCQATDEVTISVHEYVFLSNGSVKVNKNKQSDGNIHSNGKIEFGAGFPGTHTGNLVAFDDISIKTKNTIVGDATAGDEIYLTGNANITGTATEHSAVAAIPLPTITFSAGGPDKSVPRNGSLNLATGSYGKVKVNSNATLFLSSGDYFIDILDTEASAKLSCNVTNGPVNVHVVTDLDLATKVQVLITGTGAATDQVSFITLQDPKVDIGKTALIRGAVIAQNAEVHFSTGCKFRGSVCADGITLDSDVKFQFHTSTASFPKPSELEDLDDEEVSSDELIVDSYELKQNYPNPFNPSTKISFAVKDAGMVQLSVYNLQGQLVRQLVSSEMNVGHHEVNWDGRNDQGRSVPSGVYLYKLEVNGFAETRKMTFMK